MLSASIRGIGQDDFAFNLNPGVGVYLDGVFLARTIGANQNLLDVDRVEILKGPQGTLFGANTIGGAISIVTHTPGNEPRFIAQATGGSYNRRDVVVHRGPADHQGRAAHLDQRVLAEPDGLGQGHSVPGQLAVSAQRPSSSDPQTAYPKAGYETNDNYDGTGVVTMRGKVLWNASDKMNVTFTGDWSHEDQTALRLHDPQHVHGEHELFDVLDPVQPVHQQQRRDGIAGRDRRQPAGRRRFVVRRAGQRLLQRRPVPNFALGCTSPRAQR